MRIAFTERNRAMLWSAVTRHRFFDGRLGGQDGRVQRTLLHKGTFPCKFDGDKSPAESGDRSPHSKCANVTNALYYLAVAFSCVIGWTCAAEEPPNKNAVAIEALSRLKGMDLETNPALKAAVVRVLERTKGTPQFVELVRDFKLNDQYPALLDYAAAHSSESSGVDAIRLIAENDQLQLLKNALNSTNAPRLLDAIANSGEKKFVPFIEPLLINSAAQPVVRKQVVHALASTQDGATELLKLAKEDKLGSDVKLAAASELNNVRWPGIKEEAARMLPLPKAQNSEALPPIAQLVKMSGDPAKGAQVFSRPEVGCISCHQVNGQGVNFGPNLSEIGTKLGKDALFEAILDPSAGISFGFETWQIELKNGDEAFGIIASESADELAVKAQNGIVSKYKKSDIAKREQMKTSIMPAGLQLAMSTQDLVDLVEYLSTLKKAEVSR